MPVISAAGNLFNMVAVLREPLGAGRARFPQYMSEGTSDPRGGNV